MPLPADAAAAEEQPEPRSRGPWFTALTFMAMGLALTWAAMSWISDRTLENKRMRFDRYNGKIEATVTQRFEDSLVALKGLRATLHAYGNHMDRQAFRTWVEQRYIDHEFTGLRGLGFIERVSRDDLPRFLARERADAAPDFQVRTTGDAPDLLVIKHIEPLQRNRAAWGYDVGSEPVRRAAAQTAIDTGQPTLTGRITLVQDGKKGPGFLYFVPVYWMGAPVDTVEERRKALIGLLYTPIVAAELLAGVDKITDGLVDFELLEAPGKVPENVLFDLDGHLSQPGQHDEPDVLKHNKTVRIGGQSLTMQTRTTAAFSAETRDLSHLAAGAGGLALSGLLSGLFWLISMSRVRAETLARQMTHDLRAAKRHAEAALRDQRALLDTLDRHSLISVTDPSGAILEVNDAFCAVSGYGREELIGNTHRLVNAGHHEPAFWVDMWQTIASGKSWQGEICNRAKDGHLYWVSSIVAPFFGDDGQIEKYISIRQDISQRKQLEDTAQAMTERYTLAIEGGHDGLWDWMDVHAHAEWWSPQFYRLLGYRPDEIPADMVTFEKLLHPDDQARTVDAINVALKEHTAFDIEYRLRTKSGEHRWFRSRAKVYVDEFGSATRMAGSIQDIHERRLAQAQLREHIDQMMTIFSLTPDAFVSFDDRHRVSYASPAFETLTSLRCDEVTGWPESELIERLNGLVREPIGLDAFRASESDQAESGHRVVLEMRPPNGRVLALSSQRGTGTTVAQVVHLRDVTRELELDRMKGEFMSMAAHELRTPMASIYGFTELLLTREVKPEKQRDLLQRIYRQSEVMVCIINELLDLARIEARQGKDFQLTDFDLAKLVDEVVRDFQPPPTRDTPTVTPPEGRVWVHADPQKTQQAVLNVLSNAFKYSPDGGGVEIGFVTEANPSDARVGPRLGVRIADHGIGLTPEQLARIGERFYRADKSGNIPGTGLGVSIVKEILNVMDGELAIESAPGEGTAVTLWLPAASVELDAPPQAEALELSS